MKKYLKTVLMAIWTISAFSTIAQTIPSSSDIACFFNWYERYTFLAFNGSPTTQSVGRLIYRKYQNGAILGTVNNRVFMRDKIGDKITDRGEISLHISAALSSNCGMPILSNVQMSPEPCPISNLDWIVNGNKCQAPVSSLLSGKSIGLQNTVVGKEGNAEFACNNGIWSVKSGAGCTSIYVAGNGAADGDGDGGDGGGGVGDGVPIANAPITLVDAKGKIIQTTTDSKGDYRVSLKGLTPPYIVKVTRPDGTEWYSPSLGEVDAVGFVRMNITGLTDKVANYLADSVGIQGGAAKINPSILSVNPAALQEAKNKLNAGLASPLTYTGINPSVFDPVRSNYVATKGNKYDEMLDRLVISKNIAKGNTVVVGTFAGVNEYLVNDVGTAATFHYPYGVAVDSMGNIYVTDSGSHAIRKITPSDVVTTLAGNGISGFTDDIGSAAKFNKPQGIAIDAFDNIYVADTNNHAIRKITMNGVVTTLAGGGIKGFLNANGRLATFNTPVGVAVNKFGDIYVTDTLNYAIRKITSTGTVSTLAGSGYNDYINGIGGNARFNYLNAIAVDSKGNVYVGDSKYATTIRKITPEGFVTTFVTSGKEADLAGVYGISVDESDNLYIVDIRKVIKITADGMKYTILAGTNNMLLYDSNPDGLFMDVFFERDRGIAVDKSGTIFVVDSINNAIRKVMPGKTISTLAGGLPGLNDGIGTSARFKWPQDIAVDNNGNAFVIDNFNVIRKISKEGAVSTIAGKPLPTDDLFGYNTNIISNSVDGVGGYAEFSGLRKITLDANKNIYVTERNKIRKITPQGLVTTLILSDKDIISIQGITVDFYENIYINARRNSGTQIDDVSSIYKITSNGLVTHFASGLGTGENGMAIDKNGNVFVADSRNNSIIKITSAGISTTLAGNAVSGLADGIGSAAKFNSPIGVTVDEKGNVFVADSGNNAIRKITPDGVVTTIAGNGSSGYSNGVNNPVITFYYPKGIAVDKNGHLFVADTINNAIRVILP